MQFSVSALTHQGKDVTKVVDAGTPTEAMAIVRQEGLFPRSAKPITEILARKNANVTLPYSKVRSVHIALGTQLGTGAATILDAVSSIIRTTNDRNTRAVMGQVRERIMAGDAFSTALAVFPRIWPESTCAAIRAGERDPTQLGDQFDSITKFMDDMEDLKRTMIGKLVMPGLTFLMGIAAFFTIIIFTLPTMGKFLKDMGVKKISPMTLHLIDLGQWIKEHYIGLIWAVLALMVVVAVFTYTGHVGRILWRVALRVPILQEMLRQQAYARFTSVFGTIWAATGNVMETLTFAAEALNIPSMRKAAQVAIERVRTKGEDFVVALRATKQFDEAFLNCIAPEQARMQMDRICGRFQDSYTKQTQYLGGRFATLIELMSLAMMATLVLFLLYVYGSPMLQVISDIKK